jgi:hypothetical protein
MRSPWPKAWRVLLAERCTDADLRGAVELATSKGITVFVDALLVHESGEVAVSPRCADPDAVTYRTGERIFLRGPVGDELALLEELRHGLALLEAAHA